MMFMNHSIIRFQWNKCCQIVSHLEFFFLVNSLFTHYLSITLENSPSQTCGNQMLFVFSFSSFFIANPIYQPKTIPYFSCVLPFYHLALVLLYLRSTQLMSVLALSIICSFSISLLITSVFFLLLRDYYIYAD